MWSKAFGGSGNDLGHSIIEMNDEGLVLAGQALSYSGTGYDEIFLVKVDKNCNSLWAKTLNGGGGEVARGIVKTADGGFVISGEEKSEQEIKIGLRGNDGNVEILSGLRVGDVLVIERK